MTRTPSPLATEGLGATPLTAEEERELRSEVARQLPKMAAFASIGGGREWPVFARLLATVDAAREQCRRAHPGDSAEPVSSDAARPSVPSEALAEALAAIERADKAVADLCSGRLRWEMRVPAEPDHDPDLIISAALGKARAVLAALPNREDAPDLISAIDRLLAVPHRDDEQPCSCDECMSYGAEDAGADWYRIPPANRIAMRILDGGDDRLAVIAAAFRDHEAAVREDAPSREGLDAAYTAIRAAIVQPDASLDTAYVPWRAIKAAFRGDREDAAR